MASALNIFHPLLLYYPSELGGTANTIYRINSALEKKGIETCVLSTLYGLQGKDLSKHQFDEDLKKVRFVKSSIFYFLLRSIKFVRKCDIIQFSSIFFPPTLPLILIAIIYNKKILLSPRGELYESAIARKSLKKNIYLRFIRIFQKKINFVATCKAESEIISSRFPGASSIEIIPNFIEVKARVLKQLNNQFVFLGRINPIKNLEALIKAFAQLKNSKCDGLKLHLMGSAKLEYEKKYLSELNELIKFLKVKDKIFFHGHITGKEKDDILASSLALILPSHSENFGNVVLEALALGTPVIASKNTPWNVLEKYYAGYHVDNDPNSLSEAMLSILNQNDIEGETMRSNAYDLCNLKFNIDNNIDLWVEYYKRIISG